MNSASALCYTPVMNKRDRIIYIVSMVLLAIELAVMIISILMHPFPDSYLRGWGIAAVITMAGAIYGFIRKLMAGRKEG